jgi:hypothetical protein
MRDNKVIQAVAVVVSVSAVAAMVLTARGGLGPSLNPEPHRTAGSELARQALSLLKPGGQIMVLTRDTATFPNPATDVLLDSFQRELRKSHVGISSEQKLEVDPLRRILVPSGDFQGWIHHANSGDVIVSFLGPPVLSAAQRLQLGEIKPAIVAFCPGNWPEQVDFRRLFGDGLLSAAIVTRYDQTPEARQPNRRPARFEQNFAVVTKANVDEFVAASEKRSAPNAP